MSTARLPTYFISHGGGPWPWIKEPPGGATRVHHERELFGGITVSSYRFG